MADELFPQVTGLLSGLAQVEVEPESIPAFALVFFALWFLGALYLLSRWVRFGKYGVFLGGRLLFEGPPIVIYQRWRHVITLAVVASSNERRPIGLKVAGRGPTSASRNVLSLSDEAAHDLRRLIPEAHALALSDPTLHKHQVGSVRSLWRSFGVFAGTDTSRVGLRMGGAMRSIPDDQYDLFIQSYDAALQAAAESATP